MGDRFLLWLGAGAVCAGVTVGMLAGAGTASAQTESEATAAPRRRSRRNPLRTNKIRVRGFRNARRQAQIRPRCRQGDQRGQGKRRRCCHQGRQGRRRQRPAIAAESNVRTDAKPEPGQARREAGQQRCRGGDARARPQGRGREGDTADRRPIARSTPSTRSKPNDRHPSSERTAQGRTRHATGSASVRTCPAPNAVEPLAGRRRCWRNHRPRPPRRTADRRAAGDQRHRHRRLRPDLIRARA